MKYPRVLVVALGRINAADAANNGLLLRNIFGRWPRQALAQIYSSGDNGDVGFFGHYYQLGPRDRQLGSLFYRLKANALTDYTRAPGDTNSHARHLFRIPFLRVAGKQLLVETGLYELVFRPRLSDEIMGWTARFQPEIILAQGYNLTFAWLPTMLAHQLQLPIVYYTTDDWPSSLYQPAGKWLRALAHFSRRAVVSASQELVWESSVCFAFNHLMREEYIGRYGKEFTVLAHGDDFSRFESVHSCRLVPKDEWWIVTTGVFNEYRLPLLFDLDDACEILKHKGFKVRATVFPVNQLPGDGAANHDFRHIHFEPCPDHDGLASVLRGADILFLAERFDDTADQIQLSISSKAHLFMFSGRPILVYSAPVTGVARYAREAGWAAIVDTPSPELLAQSLETLMSDESYRRNLISTARTVAMGNHHLPDIQQHFLARVSSAAWNLQER